MLSKIKKPEDLECYEDYLRLIRSDLKKFKRAAAKDPALKEPFYIISEYTFKHEKPDDGKEVVKPVVVVGDLKSAIERDELKTKSSPSTRLKGSCGIKDDKWQLQPDGGNMKLKTLKKELKPFWKEVKVKFADVEILAAESNDDADGLELKQRDGIKLSGKSGYAQIKNLLAELKNIPKNNIEERIRVMSALTQQAANWEAKHAKTKPSKREKKIFEELAALRMRLEPVLYDLKEKQREIEEKAQLDYQTGNIQLLLKAYKDYQQPNDAELIELASGGPDAFAQLNDKLEDLADILSLVEGWRATNKGKDGLDKEHNAVDKIEARVKQYRYEIQQALQVEVGEDEFIAIDESKGQNLSKLFEKKTEVKEQFRADVILWDQTLYKGFDQEIEQEMRAELQKAGKTEEEIEQSIANRKRVLEEQQQLVKRNFLAMAALGVEMGDQKKPSSFKAYDKPVPLASLSSHGGRFAFESADSEVAERFQRLLMMGDQEKAVRKDGPVGNLFGGLMKGTKDPRNLLSADTSDAYAGFYNRVSTHPQHFDAEKGAWIEGKSLMGSYHDNSIGLDLPFGGVGNSGPKGKILQEGLFQQEDGELGQHGHGLFVFDKDAQGGGRMMVAFEGASPSRANQTGAAHDIISASSSVLKKTSLGKKFLKSINRYEERSVSGQSKAADVGLLPEDEEEGKVLKEGALRARLDEQKLQNLQKLYEAIDLVKRSGDKALQKQERQLMQQLMASTDQEKRQTLTEALVDLGMKAQQQVQRQEWLSAVENLKLSHEKYLELDKSDTTRVDFARNNHQWILQLLNSTVAEEESEKAKQLEAWKEVYDKAADELDQLDVNRQAESLKEAISTFEELNEVRAFKDNTKEDYQFAKTRYEEALALQNWLNSWLPRADKEVELHQKIQQFAKGLPAIIKERSDDMLNILEGMELNEADKQARDGFLSVIQKIERAEMSSMDNLQERLGDIQILRQAVSNWEPAEAENTILRNGLLGQIEQRYRDYSQELAAQQQKAARTKVDELKEKGKDADSLFDAFMGEYRGKLKLDAYSDGSNVLAGGKVASPVAVANAFAALLMDAGLEANVTTYSKVFSEETDGKWIGSNSGNVYDVEKGKAEHFYFPTYATVKSGGTEYCLCLGQKGTAIKAQGLSLGAELEGKILHTYANTTWLATADGQAFVWYKNSFSDNEIEQLVQSPLFYNTDKFADIRARFIEFIEGEFSSENYLFTAAMMAGRPKDADDAKALYEEYLGSAAPKEINVQKKEYKTLRELYDNGRYAEMAVPELWANISLTTLKNMNDTMDRFVPWFKEKGWE